MLMARAVFLAGALLAVGLPVAAAPPADRPVMVGGQLEIDACPSVAVLVPLREGGDGFVAVRAAPSVKARRLYKLLPGQEVLLCGSSADGQWVGVIYPEPLGGPDVGECRVSIPIAGKRRAYGGPCRSGWVARRFLTVIAG
jgi:hypothetical protein